MASPRQIEANRLNAKRSSGPKSHAGKQRAAQNSTKHGLSVNLLSMQSADSQLEKLAARFAGRIADSNTLECSRAIAAAELELRRIRRIRVGLIQSARAGSNAAQSDDNREGSPDASSGPSQSKEKRSSSGYNADPVCRAMPDLVSLVRYEIRAVAKRDKAVRHLMQLRQSRSR
jgi:hypothetical protein